MFMERTLGGYKTAIDRLDDQIPSDGKVKQYWKKPKLEKYRRAVNVIHDIFNNGLMNRGKELKLLGLQKYELALDRYDSRGELIRPADWDRVEDRVAEKFIPILEDAINETFGLVYLLTVKHNRGKL